MAKTKPIGVRFDEDLLNKVKGASLADSPQKALNLYERSYLELIEMKVAKNNKPENKVKIEAERDTASSVGEKHTNSLPSDPEDYETKQIKERIAELEKELKSPAKNPQVGLRMWIAIREKELRELKEKLK